MTTTNDNQARVREIYRRIVAVAEREQWDATALSYYVGQPFKALIAAMLSAQTREEHTIAATRALFALADNPAEMLALSDEQVLHSIRRVSYPLVKATYVRDICQKLVERGGEVPQTVDELTTFKGVGWKVAVLTLAVGYGRTEDITVDVHVLRIGIRMGLIPRETKKPPKANDILKTVLPRDLWAGWNDLMVRFGRAICAPTYPKCKICPINDLCPKIGVEKPAR
ncbi:MAG: endonuclease III [Anaerolineae bacterium]|nr:endonuclease III [Anaerolineae bacterium]